MEASKFQNHVYVYLHNFAYSKVYRGNYRVVFD